MQSDRVCNANLTIQDLDADTVSVNRTFEENNITIVENNSFLTAEVMVNRHYNVIVTASNSNDSATSCEPLSELAIHTASYSYIFCLHISCRYTLHFK